MPATSVTPAAATPRLDARSLVTMLVAGALATVAFDFYGQSLSPMLGFASLAPVPLANSAIEAVFGAPYEPGAQFLHYVAGMIAYPLGWMLIARPLAARFVPAMPWWVAATVYGVSALGLRAVRHGASGRGPAGVPRLHRHHLGRAGRAHPLRAGRGLRRCAPGLTRRNQGCGARRRRAGAESTGFIAAASPAPSCRRSPCDR